MWLEQAYCRLRLFRFWGGGATGVSPAGEAIGVGACLVLARLIPPGFVPEA